MNKDNGGNVNGIVAKRRGKSLGFGAMSVAHADDEDCEVYQGERLLSNGDCYSGQWVDGLPQGNGKYVWIDGCMYVGEWNKGKAMGKGKFFWASGASFQGEFKSGYMDGKGTFVGSLGDTYRGYWVMNLKHGYGTKSYANGDYYEGEWRRGLQDGDGRYWWKNRNHYIGQWRKGMIWGTGKMNWKNGNRYEGYWEEGMPKGNGTFRWANGSFYVGVWSKEVKEQSGTFYPSGSPVGTIDWDPQDVFAVDLNDCRVCQDEKVLVFPSQKMMNWPGVEVDSKPMKGNSDANRRPRRMSADGRVSNYAWELDKDTAKEVSNPVSKDGENPGNVHQEALNKRGKCLQRLRMQSLHATKRQGLTICKGHKNYELMLNLQLGIRHSVGKYFPETSLDLKASAFDPKEKVWTRFPPEGSKYTPPHQSCEFRWKDYCPVVFRTLRKFFKVDAADYMLSICGNEALRELSSPGKSGSFFYLTNDDRYMIKTIKKAELKVLIRMLPAYYNHVRAFQNTLVTRFYGLHSVKLTGPAQKKVRFVIMGNLFCSEYAIHRRFDLKGSSQGRVTGKSDTEIDPTTTLKDLDLKYIFRLQKSWFQEFCRQVDKDCDFLEQERIMDYSLLVGLHFKEISYVDSMTPRSSGNEAPDSEATTPYNSRVDKNHLPPDNTRQGSISLGINMPAQVEQTLRRNEYDLIGEPTGKLHEVVLFFGIIDILQDYDISKKLEHAYKSFQYDPTSISAVDPKQYSKRFRDFIFRVFVQDS